jgi:nucleotide-binding universal stress UspA family protein
MAEQLIVVPLDGSELSERAVPYAALYAKTFGGRILLATVWEGAEQALIETLPAVADDLFKEGENYYEKYLASVAEKYLADGVKVDAEVLTGKPADTILKLIEERHADVLVLATHGRSGIGRWWYGSVAGEIAQQATIPRIIVGPKVLSQPTKAIKVDGVLVPLDGSKLSEAALEHGARIANAFGAALHVVQAISPVAQTYLFDVPSVTSVDVQARIDEGVGEYLANIARKLENEATVKTHVLRGPAADVLVDYIEEHGIDLVVMASHGRGGLARVALGSVADRMLQSDAPVFLIRPSEQAE